MTGPIGMARMAKGDTSYRRVTTSVICFIFAFEGLREIVQPYESEAVVLAS